MGRLRGDRGAPARCGPEGPGEAQPARGGGRLRAVAGAGAGGPGHGAGGGQGGEVLPRPQEPRRAHRLLGLVRGGPHPGGAAAPGAQVAHAHAAAGAVAGAVGLGRRRGRAEGGGGRQGARGAGDAAHVEPVPALGVCAVGGVRRAVRGPAVRTGARGGPHAQREAGGVVRWMD